MRPALSLVALLLAACGGQEERAIFFEVEAASPCWSPATRIRALQVRAVDAAQYPTALPTLPGFDECLPVDVVLTRQGLGTPFQSRGYIFSGLPAGKRISIHLMAYNVPPCPKPEQRSYAACLSSDPFVAESASTVKMRATCGPLSPCGNIR